MSPGDVRTFKRGSGNALVVGLGVWTERRGGWIDIHLTGPGHSHTTVTNNPNSVRYHRTLFRDLRRTLILQACWSFGDEGAETEANESAHSEQLASEAPPRFHPVPITGAASASDLILQDRGSR